MPKGLKGFQKGNKIGLGKYKPGQGFQEGHKVYGGFQKGNPFGNKFIRGHKINLGKHWKIKDTLNYKGTVTPQQGFKKGHKINLGRKGGHWNHTDISKQKMREWHINHPNQKFKDTSIELKIEAELQRRNIYYQKQVPLCSVAIVDFYLPEYRIVIQCDGDYWHNSSKQKETDARQDKILIFNGFNIYRFWEHEINESPEKCIDKLLINRVG